LVKAVERRRIDEFGAAADAALAQVPVGEEGELKRCDRALDRHVDEVHDQAAAIEALERTSQRAGTRCLVEGENAFVPALAGEPFSLLGLQARTCRDDEHVIDERLTIQQHDLVVVRVDPRDLCAMKLDAVSQLAAARIAPRSVFFIYALDGTGGEEKQLNPKYYAAAGGPKQIWEISEASHTEESRPGPRNTNDA
jgi:hypothetical protein